MVSESGSMRSNKLVGLLVVLAGALELAWVLQAQETLIFGPRETMAQ